MQLVVEQEKNEEWLRGIKYVQDSKCQYCWSILTVADAH